MAAKQLRPGTLRWRIERITRRYTEDYRRWPRRYRLNQAERDRRRTHFLARLDAEKQALVLSVHDWVWKCVNQFCTRYPVQAQDRYDCAQAAFLRVLMGAEVYDPRQTRPTTYLGYVAWDGMKKWWQRRGDIYIPGSAAKARGAEHRSQAARVQEANFLSLEWEYGDDTRPPGWAIEEPEPPLYECDELDALHAALQRLPERYRIVALGVAAGRTKTELGVELGISKERVRQIYLKAVSKLRRLLGADRPLVAK